MRAARTDAFHFSAACTKMYTNGTCPWSVWSSVAKSMDIDLSTSAGQGLSTRNETFSSKWLSMTILSSQFRSIQRESEQGGEREVRTSMFMTLQIKFREEARSAYGNEGRSGGVSPEVRSEPFKGGPGKVVGNDERIRVDKLRVLLQDIRNVLKSTTNSSS